MKHLSLNNFLKSSISVMLLLVTPLVAFAAPDGLIKFVDLANSIITALFPIVTAIAILVFGYNIAKYLTSKNQADQNLYKAGLINSMIAIFVIFVVIGLIRGLASSLGISALGVDITVSDPSGLSAGSGSIATFRRLTLSISKFLSTRIVPIMVASALLMFFGNIVISMTKSDEEGERTKLNAYLRWGILALFLLLTLFSVVGLFTGSLFGTGAVIPQFPTSDGG